MDVAVHLEKFRRLEATMAKLDLEADYETLIESAMHAATHLVNVLLHRRGLTPDLLHVGMPPIEDEGDARVAEALAALKTIEDLRPFYVRGTEPYTPEVSGGCLEAYRRVKRAVLG